MNPQEIKKMIADLMEECRTELEYEGAEESVEVLQDALRSGTAIEFTESMNKQLPNPIDNPANAFSDIAWSDDRKHAQVDLTPEEERWLRANKLYGNDMLGKLGFKYTNE